MLGHNLFETFSENKKFETFGVIRKTFPINVFKENAERIKSISDAREIEEIKDLLKEVSPEVIINCIGLIKQKNPNVTYRECEEGHGINQENLLDILEWIKTTSL